MTDLRLLQEAFVYLADAQEILLRRNLTDDEKDAGIKLLNFCKIMLVHDNLTLEFENEKSDCRFCGKPLTKTTT